LKSEPLYYIYALKCPITKSVRYIGKTINLKERFRKHLTTKKKTACSKWIFSLKMKGLKPEIVVLKLSCKNSWQNDERELISSHNNLLNHTAGGEGGNTMGGRKLTKEQANKISLSKIGKPRHDTALKNKLIKGSKIVQYDIHGNIVSYYDSIKDAARAVNRCDRRIQCMVKGEKINGKNINHVAGFTFKYAI